MAQRLHQPQHTVGARRRSHQHRTNQAVAQLLGEIIENLVAWRLDILEQLLHQLVIVVGERLQHGETRRLLAVERVAFKRDHFRRCVLLVDKRALEREIHEAADELAGEGRNLSQQELAARGRLQQRQHLVDSGIGFVDLVDKQEARNVLLLELAQDKLELRDLLLVQLANHDRRIDCRQRRAHVVDEFNRARTVDERIAVALESGGGDGELHAHAVVARLLAAVADRGARLHRALALDRAGAGEDRFQQGRLAALERAHQRDAPWTRSSCAVLCHIRFPYSIRDAAFVGTIWAGRNYRFRQEGGLARGARLRSCPPAARCGSALNWP